MAIHLLCAAFEGALRDAPDRRRRRLLDRDLDGRAERLAPDAPVPVVEASRRAARRRRGAGRHARRARRPTSPWSARWRRDAAGEELRDAARRGRRAGDRPGPRRPHAREDPRPRRRARPVVRLDHGDGARAAARWPAGALDGADAVLVSDYGRGVAAEPTVRAALDARARPARLGPAPARPRPGVAGATLVTPNLREAAGRGIDAHRGADCRGASTPRARSSARWRAVAVAVTLGARGALLVAGDGPALRVPARPRGSGDPCGAGDCFAATAARRGSRRARSRPRRSAARSRRRPAFVAGGGAGALTRPPPRGRARGPSRRPPRAAPTPRRHRRRHRRLLRPAARRARPHARAGARARRLPDRVPELRRVRAPAEGRRPPARRAGRPRRGAARAGLRRRRRRLRRGRPAPPSCDTLRPHVWVKGGDYAARAARGRDARRMGRSRRRSSPTSTAAPPPD